MSLLNSGEKLGPYEILNPLGARWNGRSVESARLSTEPFRCDQKESGQSSERSSREAQAIAALTLAASYVAGNLFFLRDGTLMVQPFDDGKLQLRGEPVPIAEHVGR